jgi:hypothetical protein
MYPGETLKECADDIRRSLMRRSGRRRQDSVIMPHKRKNKGRWFKVRLGKQVIEQIYQTCRPGETLKECADDIRRSLINHDGYDSSIRVSSSRK